MFLSAFGVFLLNPFIFAAWMLWVLVRGERDERGAAGALVGTAAMIAWAEVASGAWFPIPVVLLIWDFGILSILLTIARRSNRFWPLWASAAHGVGAITDLGFLLDLAANAGAYLEMRAFWALIIMVPISLSLAFRSGFARADRIDRRF